MKAVNKLASLLFLAVLSYSFSLLWSAFATSNRKTHDKIISLNLKSRSLVKRDGSEYPLANRVGYYYHIDGEAGTQNKTLSFAIDTSQPYSWVVSTEFSATDSTTYVSSGESFSYTDTGSLGTASGSLGTDTLYIGDLTIPNTTIGIATDNSNAYSAALGLGLEDGANQLIDQMYDNGLIDKKIFSLYLDNINLPGVIDFGGADSSYYEGEIKYVSIIETCTNGYYIKLADIDDPNGTSLGNGEAVIDYASILSLVPDSVMTRIASTFHGTYDDSTGLYTVDCEAMSISTLIYTLEFDNDISIDVLGSQLFYTNSDTDTCYLTVTSSGDDSYLLGQSFLTSAYVVFDLQDSGNVQIGFAQVDVNRNVGTTCNECSARTIVCSSCTSSIMTTPTVFSSTTVHTALSTLTFISSLPSSSSSSSSSILTSSTSSITLSSYIPCSSSITSSSSTHFHSSATSSSSILSSSYDVPSSTPGCDVPFTTSSSTELTVSTWGTDGSPTTTITPSFVVYTTSFSCSVSSSFIPSSSASSNSAELSSSSITSSYSSFSSNSVTSSSSIPFSTPGCDVPYATYSTTQITVSTTNTEGSQLIIVTQSIITLASSSACSVSSIPSSYVVPATSSVVSPSSTLPTQSSSIPASSVSPSSSSHSSHIVLSSTPGCDLPFITSSVVPVTISSVGPNGSTTSIITSSVVTFTMFSYCPASSGSTLLATGHNNGVTPGTLSPSSTVSESTTGVATITNTVCPVCEGSSGTPNTTTYSYSYSYSDTTTSSTSSIVKPTTSTESNSLVVTVSGPSYTETPATVTGTSSTESVSLSTFSDTAVTKYTTGVTTVTTTICPLSEGSSGTSYTTTYTYTYTYTTTSSTPSIVVKPTTSTESSSSVTVSGPSYTETPATVTGTSSTESVSLSTFSDTAVTKYTTGVTTVTTTICPLSEGSSGTSFTTTYTSTIIAPIASSIDSTAASPPESHSSVVTVSTTLSTESVSSTSETRASVPDNTAETGSTFSMETTTTPSTFISVINSSSGSLASITATSIPSVLEAPSLSSSSLLPTTLVMSETGIISSAPDISTTLPAVTVQGFLESSGSIETVTKSITITSVTSLPSSDDSLLFSSSTTPSVPKVAVSSAVSLLFPTTTLFTSSIDAIPTLATVSSTTTGSSTYSVPGVNTYEGFGVKSVNFRSGLMGVIFGFLLSISA